MKELLEEIKKVYPANWLYDDEQDLICHDEGSALYNNDYCISTLSNGYLIYCSGYSFTFPEKKDLLMTLKKFYSHDTKKQPNSIIELLEEIKKSYPAKWIYEDETQILYNGDGCAKKGNDYCMTINYRVTPSKRFDYYCIRGTNYVKLLNTKQEFIEELKSLYKKHK